ncbi:hypothetical protein [Achromobacter ruhlandii]|uniref:hypothetical protein n=1 Tax=Achromobacter ruhlandii TaxID=72557 RepID=UPI001EEE6F94|nr:hypothetical protein [Achromobacter ruhlandii]MCZ8397644.1 hypothetical protein [Achromobacter ruhlandii]
MALKEGLGVGGGEGAGLPRKAQVAKRKAQSAKRKAQSKNPENLAIFGVFNFLPTLPVYIAT